MSRFTLARFHLQRSLSQKKKGTCNVQNVTYGHTVPKDLLITMGFAATENMRKGVATTNAASPTQIQLEEQRDEDEIWAKVESIFQEDENLPQPQHPPPPFATQSGGSIGNNADATRQTSTKKEHPHCKHMMNYIHPGSYKSEPVNVWEVSRKQCNKPSFKQHIQ